MNMSREASRDTVLRLRHHAFSQAPSQEYFVVESRVWHRGVSEVSGRSEIAREKWMIFEPIYAGFLSCLVSSKRGGGTRRIPLYLRFYVGLCMYVCTVRFTYV